MQVLLRTICCGKCYLDICYLSCFMQVLLRATCCGKCYLDMCYLTPYPSATLKNKGGQAAAVQEGVEFLR